MPETMRVHVDSLAYGGAGVAHAPDGRTVFVRYSCPGDTLQVEVTAEHPRYLEAAVREIVEPSPERRNPPCPYFGRCGGCQWQHVSRSVQVAARRASVSDALRRIGKIPEPEVAEVRAAGSAYGYRNKVEFTVGADERGGLVLGLLAEHTDTLVPIDACLLLPDAVRAYPKALAGALRYLSRGGDLGLTRVAVRAAANKRDVEVDLWGRPGPFPRQAVAKTLGQAVRFDSLTRVLANDPAKDRSRAKIEMLAGHGQWHERLSGRSFAVSAPSFFQVNTPVAEVLADLVTSELAPDGTDRVLDLFAGVGTFTLPLAELAGEVVAIESAGSAVRDLRANLETAGLDAEVAPGDAVRVLADEGHFDLAVVDPPRTGLAPDVRDALVAASPRRIVYVSCDPATLARDVAALQGSGYTLVRATPVDLFPQTYHVETVAVLDAG
jgi:23S rRNA (uracil1939-C5)-methyltransferase